MKSSGPVVIRSTTSCWVTESLLVGRIRSIKHDSLTEHKAANKLNNYVCSWQRARPEFYHQIPNCSATARVSSDLLIYLRYRPEEFDLFFFSSPALRQLLTHSLPLLPTYYHQSNSSRSSGDDKTLNGYLSLQSTVFAFSSDIANYFFFLSSFPRQ